jgi:DNA-binding HxlR family transcriptional regulator
MTKDYGQFCGLSHALDLIGGRWTLMIVRELLVGPKRFTELEHGLPGIPTNVLSSRLRELEEHGLVERRLLPRPSSSVVYELTEYGRELEDPLIRLGRWGARSLQAPTHDDFMPTSALMLGLRAMFHADEARGVHFGFEVPVRDFAIKGRVDDGVLTVPVETEAKPDLTIRGDPATMLGLFRQNATVTDAAAERLVEIDGSIEDAQRFFRIFNLN